jgi:hypothetical protein
MVGAAVVALAANACATSRMGEADIRQEEGTPCFTITQKEEQRAGIPRLMALSVYDVSVKPVTEVWKFALPVATAMPISSKICIRYNQAPAGAEGIKALSLVTGRVYEVFLNTKLADTADSTFGYMGKFCLLTEATITTLHQLKPGTQGWRDGTCKP